MSIKDFTFHNYPQKISMEPYIKAREEFINFFKKFDSVVSIYEYGKVAAPGVSDLDIIVVVNKDNNLELHDANFSSITQALIGSGNIIFIDTASFNKILFIEDLQINLLYGYQFVIECPTEVDKKYINLVSILDWVPERSSRLQNYLNKKNIDVVTILCVLNSLLYSFEKAKFFYEFDIEDFKEKLSNLRHDYFAYGNANLELFQLIQMSIRLSNKLFNNHLFFLKSNNIFYGASDENESNYLELYLSNQLGFNDPTALMNIPYEFYYHFLTYGLANNYLSKKFKKKFNKVSNLKYSDVPFDLKYKEIQINKISICNHNANFLLKNNINKGLIRFGYLL